MKFWSLMWHHLYFSQFKNYSLNFKQQSYCGVPETGEGGCSSDGDELFILISQNFTIEFILIGTQNLDEYV